LGCIFAPFRSAPDRPRTSRSPQIARIRPNSPFAARRQIWYRIPYVPVYHPPAKRVKLQHQDHLQLPSLIATAQRRVPHAQEGSDNSANVTSVTAFQSLNWDSAGRSHMTRIPKFRPSIRPERCAHSGWDAFRSRLSCKLRNSKRSHLPYAIALWDSASSDAPLLPGTPDTWTTWPPTSSGWVTSRPACGPLIS
jgi:hypothetical protein